MLTKKKSELVKWFHLRKMRKDTDADDKKRGLCMFPYGPHCVVDGHPTHIFYFIIKDVVHNKKYGKASVDSAVEFETILNSTADSTVDFTANSKIWFITQNMDPWIHGSAAGAAGGAAAFAATARTYYGIIVGGGRFAPPSVST